MTWFDSTTPYITTSRSAVDRLSHTQDAGGSNPSSSTVTEVRSGRDAGTWPRRKSVRVRPVTLRGHWVQRGLIRPARGFDSRPRDHAHSSGPVAQLGSAAPLQGEGCGFESRA